MEILPELYPLTGLQIGDIQSYVSWAFLYFASESNRVMILIDNRPWLTNKYSRSAKIWQLMVTKYRVSPFTNTRTTHNTSRRNRRKNSNNGDDIANHCKLSVFSRLFSVISSKKWQEKYFLPAMDPSKALHGFIVFDVVWKDVHGINYLNELQMDTALALEVKSMTKWEFHSPEQASRCISSWFSGKISDSHSLKKKLRHLSDVNFHTSNTRYSSVYLQKPTPSEAVSDEDDFLDVPESPMGTDDEEEYFRVHDHISSSHYSDTMILCRFSDCLLPMKLREIIMADLRLLTLLEAGLPSWVIFFQSYPLFSHFYRPWMRHLARSLYVLISLTTVIIGFYDLYKNVPLLKATVARLSGPLFGWIEGWDMVTRIRYLGTMLFLQNLEKGLRWFMMMSRTLKALVSAIVRPLSGPIYEVIEVFSPLWNGCEDAVYTLFSTVCFCFASTYSMILEFFEFVLWPFELLLSYLWSIGMQIFPLIRTIRNIGAASVSCLIAMADYLSIFLHNAFEMLKDVWEFVSSIFQFAALSDTKKAANDVSIWQGLWKDIFSKVFQATKSVVNGMSTFFMTCNRHRLSTYNHVQSFFQRHSLFARNTRTCQCQCQATSSTEHNQQGDIVECKRCKWL